MKAPFALRGLTLALLAALLVVALRDTSYMEPGRGGTARMSGEPWYGTAGLDSALASDSPPGLVVRTTTEPPTETELELLSAAAREVPLVAALPSEPPPLRALPLPRLHTDRASAVGFTLRGEPGDRLLVRLTDELGVVDSAWVELDATGEGAATFRIRPNRSGWHEWWLEASSPESGAPEYQATETHIGAWVHAAEPPRTLLIAGPPTLESRMIARALEEAGRPVTVALDLGRGLAVSGGTTRLTEYDVVLLLPGAALPPDERAALLDFVTEWGGGLLDAGGGGVRPILEVGEEWVDDEVRGGEIVWAASAELTPLPAAPIRVAAARVAGLGPAALGIAFGRDRGRGDIVPPGPSPDPATHHGALLALQGAGRGRVAALGLRESWRWRLEAGLVDEHREFWRDLVDWLAGGLRDSVLVHAPAAAAPLVPLELEVEAIPSTHSGDLLESAASGQAAPGSSWSAESSPGLLLTRPTGEAERLVLVPAPGDPGTMRGTVLPEEPGVYAVAYESGRVLTAFHLSDQAPPAEAGWARLALLAHSSGGASLPADSVELWVEGWRARRGAKGPAVPLRALLFGALILTATAEWTLRRLRGLR